MREVADTPSTVIIGVDPGLMTGWAAVTLGQHAFSSGQIESRFAVYDWIRAVAAQGLNIEIVCENFDIDSETHKKTRQYDAFWIAGWLEGEAAHKGWTYKGQGRASGKTFGGDESLKAIGWYRPGQGHANDAARHLFKYVIDNHRQANGLGEKLMRQVLAALEDAE